MHKHVDHPCIQHKMAWLRDANTPPKLFRDLVTELSTLLCYEALREADLEDVTVHTPMGDAPCRVLADDVLVVPILRAGVGMLEGAMQVVPTSLVGFVGLARDPKTKEPVEYYINLPDDIDDPLCMVVDPMLATGGSMVATLDHLKNRGLRRIVVVCIVSCPEGLRAVEKAHPDVNIFAGAIDERLDRRKYIVPGLGDAGDRLFGTGGTHPGRELPGDPPYLPR